MSAHDIDASRVWWVGAVTLISILIAVASVLALLGWWAVPIIADDPTIRKEPFAVRGPDLQSAPQPAMRRRLEAQREESHRLGWVDRERRIARIPIEVAMDIVARGAPVVEGAEVPTVAAPVSAVGFDQRLGEALPLDARFTDASGRQSPLSVWFGDRPVVLAMGYFRCPQLCGLLQHGLMQALADAEVPPQDYRVVFASVDETEGPADGIALLERLRRYALWLEETRQRTDWAQRLDLEMLTGTRSSIDALASSTGFGFERVTDEIRRSTGGDASQPIAHKAGIVVLTPQGVVSKAIPGIAFDPSNLRSAIVDAGRGDVGTLVDRVAMLCAYFDPRQGRWSDTVMAGIRGFFGTTLLLLVLWVVCLHRRRRG